MGPRAARAPSSTSTLPMSRPLSAQSTRSNDSNATQPLSSGQSMNPQFNHGQQPHQAVPPEWQDEVHYHHHQQAALQGHMSLAGLDPHFLPYAQQPMPFTQANFTYQRMQSPAVSSIEGNAMGTVNGDIEQEAPKKKGSATSQANDVELRRLYQENEGKSLDEVATDVRREGKGPKAEKSKQVYGMVWLAKNIRASTNSVPRNRVYTSYASRCADDHLPLLNPASFGKLVRIIHPGISTRRLGVRGESKYHYVNLSLVNDDGRGSERPSTSGGKKQEPSKTRPLSLQPRTSGEAEQGSASSTPALAAKGTSNHVVVGHKRASTIFLQDNSDDSIVSVPRKRMKTMTRNYGWPSRLHEPLDAAVDLPKIQPYLPAGTDEDAARNLEMVYLSHCRLAVDKFRFCQTDALAESFKSLIGLLTVPSQKLMTNHQIAAWIEACDTLKYQRMSPLLRHILLSAIPGPAMAHMEKVAVNLCGWIRQYFNGQPQHLIDAMLRPAQSFCKLIHRFIRVNRSAHDLAAVSNTQELRDELWAQWVQGSDGLTVVEDACDPALGGHHRLLYMLYQESRFVLQPSREALDRTTGSSLFDEQTWTNLEPPAAVAFREREEKEVTESKDKEPYSALHRLYRLLQDLPSRYPGVEAEEILSYVTRVVGTTTRNMALNQTGSGLQTWWMVSMFISEAMYFWVEYGGFISREPTTVSTPSTSAYLSPYESMNETAKPTVPPQQQQQSNSKRGSITQSKLAELESAFSSSNDGSKANRQTQKSRVSLGGETAVGDDDDDYASLEHNIGLDWSGVDMKDPGLFAQPGAIDGTQSLGAAN